MKVRYDDRLLSQWYEFSVYEMGLPLYNELSDSEKYALANTLSFSIYTVNHNIRLLARQVINKIKKAI